MEIHKRIFEAVPGYWTNAFEDISRGVHHGVERPLDAALGIRHVDEFQKMRKRIEGIRLEYDVDLGIDLEDDLKELDVALEGVRSFLTAPTIDERERIKADIFKSAAFSTIRDIHDWSKKYKA